MQKIGQRLRLAMVEKGMNQLELAKKSRIAYKYISKILNDEAPGLSAERLGRVCLALDLPLDVREVAVKPTAGRPRNAKPKRQPRGFYGSTKEKEAAFA